MNEINKLMGDIEFESRKRGVEFYLDAQLDSTIDLRFRTMNPYRVFCSATPPFSMNPKYKPEFFTYVITYQHRIVQSFILKASEALKYYPLYNTYYLVKRPYNPKLHAKILLQQDPKAFNAEVIRISNAVFEICQAKGISDTQITHPLILTLINDLNENGVYEKEVYARVKTLDIMSIPKVKKKVGKTKCRSVGKTEIA